MEKAENLCLCQSFVFLPRVNTTPGTRVPDLQQPPKLLDPLSQELEEWMTQKTNGECFRKECYLRGWEQAGLPCSRRVLRKGRH